MGIYGNIVYIHKNLISGAERFEARITGGLEAAQIVGQSNTGTDINATSQLGKNLRLNSFEIGPEITLKLPRLFPLSYCSSGKNSSPSTSFSALVNYQIRPDYERTLGQIGLSWNWVENPTRVSRMTIDGIELSIISINKSDAFEAFLKKLNDRFLANSYSNHIIEASRVTYVINTQKKADQRRSYYLRISGEAAGNVLRGFKQYIVKEPLEEGGYYKIANIQFAQYFKGEVDYRYYFTANSRNKFVARAYGGLGVARKNFLVLPFEKSFFSGGANGIRAWQARTLGPGSYRDPDNAKTYNNIGDIKLEFNLEYRFKLTQMFQAAFFIDAGNIWVLRPDEIRAGAQFKFDTFVSEIAIGSGLGIRIDFEYFLVRMDVGVQMKDPSKVEGERWFFEPKNEYNQFIHDHNFDVREYSMLRTRVFNLGIGFPF